MERSDADERRPAARAGRRILIGGAPAKEWPAAGPEPRPPIALLHGFAAAPESFDELAALLPEDRRVVALALPGHDPAAPIEPRGGFEGAAARIAAAVAALGRGATLCGYSLGARLALAAALLRPEIAAELILVGVNPGLADPAARAARAAWDAGWAARLRAEGIEAFAAAWEALPLFATQRALPEDKRAAQRALRLKGDAASLAAAMETLGLAAMPDYAPRLAELAAPTTLVAGGLDAKFRAIAAAAAPSLRRGRFVVAPGAGHNVVLEAPAFLAGLLADRPRAAR